MPRKLFINGRIFTSSGADTLQDAMLIEDGRVVCVGTEAEVRVNMVVSRSVLAVNLEANPSHTVAFRMTTPTLSISSSPSFSLESSTGTLTSSCSAVP